MMPFDSLWCAERANQILKGRTMKLVELDQAVVYAAAQFLRSGECLHKISVGGRMMDRAEVAEALSVVLPGPKGHYRDPIDAGE